MLLVFQSLKNKREGAQTHISSKATSIVTCLSWCYESHSMNHFKSGSSSIVKKTFCHREIIRK